MLAAEPTVPAAELMVLNGASCGVNGASCGVNGVLLLPAQRL